MPFEVNLNVYLHEVPDPRVDQILSQLSIVVSNQEKILMNEQQALAALKEIDSATNALAGNITVIGNSTQRIATDAGTVKTELEALLASSTANPAVPQSVTDALTSLVAKTGPLVATAQAATDALAAQVPVLQGIAAEGNIANVVPVAPAPVVIDPAPPNPPVGVGA